MLYRSNQPYYLVFIFHLVLLISWDVSLGRSQAFEMSIKKGFQIIEDPVQFNSSCSCPCIVIFPGFIEVSASLALLEFMIKTSFPCATVEILDTKEGIDSVKPLWDQISMAKDKLKDFFRTCPKITAVAHSQGGLLARGVIQSLPNHNFTTLITVVSPLMGIEALPVPLVNNLGLFSEGLRGLTGNALCREMYKDSYQKTLSLAGFYECYGPDENGNDWQKTYMNKSIFLPYLNNEKNHNNSAMFKKNFMKLNRVVNIGLKTDFIVYPPGSAVWQTIVNGKVIEMKDQMVYRKDTFGLKTMDQQKKLLLIYTTGYDHLTITSDITAYKTLIEPYLCEEFKIL